LIVNFSFICLYFYFFTSPTDPGQLATIPNNNNNSKREFYRHRFIRVLVLLPFLVYTNISNRVAGALLCIKVGGELKLAADLSQTCFQGLHAPVFAVALVLAVFYVMALPLMTLLLLSVNRDKLVGSGYVGWCFF
jgi:hypothetical protein